MNDAFPPLRDAADLGSRVLCFAPHPDDELLGCGGMLALHAARGDRVRVVLCSGDAGRVAEARAGLAELGVTDVVALELPDGALGASAALEERVAAALADLEPSVVYAPSPFEHHPDHRAVFDALARAGRAVPALRCLLWGVNAPAPREALFDVSAHADAKRRALAHHASQDGARLAALADAVARAATLDVDLPEVAAVEAFADRRAGALLAFGAQVAALRGLPPGLQDLPRATAVLTSFNKRDDVRENLAAIHRQTLPFAQVVVVDNCSSDGTREMIEAEFPGVTLVVMPTSDYGACETFNVGFECASTPLVAILDDDIVMPPDWLEKATRRLVAEPASTAIVSTKVVEPGMPDSYRDAPAVNTERYMSTFRGCASLARRDAIRAAGYYDVRLFIYGNERDLTCRLLNLGYRVLQYPGTEVFHRTPFGIKPGKRSLYYHARNAWLTMLKYAPAGDLARLPFLVLAKVVLRGGKKEAAGDVAVAVGTIGIGRSLRETPGALFIVLKALGSILWNLPYCLKHRAPVHHPDFDLPLE
ncbi:MAG: PIG-L family deacetylase [Planctomycetes bacterium]|nr:PIG-L family deacetylase [Planctomycetota bacterium]